MLLVDCPLCDGPAPFDADDWPPSSATACGVRLERRGPEPWMLAAAA